MSKQTLQIENISEWAENLIGLISNWIPKYAQNNLFFFRKKTQFNNGNKSHIIFIQCSYLNSTKKRSIHIYKKKRSCWNRMTYEINCRKWINLCCMIRWCCCNRRRCRCCYSILWLSNNYLRILLAFIMRHYTNIPQKRVFVGTEKKMHNAWEKKCINNNNYGMQSTHQKIIARAKIIWQKK